MRLKDGVALVAGASGDIGRAISFDLLGAGAEAFMLGRSMARLIQPPPPEHLREKCRYVAADLTDGAAVERASAELPSSALALRFRRDVGWMFWFLSSGTYERSSETDVFAGQIAANVLGPYALFHRLLPLLLATKGQVVFINSSQGLRATAGLAQYAATKHATKAVADSLRDEVNAHGVRVMSLFLGRTASERQRIIFASEGRPYPPERLIQATDVAEVVLSLLRLPRTAEATDIVLRPMQKT
jgi:NADP-dependent 3-hydroxy acid dehydrogenase YdfG